MRSKVCSIMLVVSIVILIIALDIYFQGTAIYAGVCFLLLLTACFSTGFWLDEWVSIKRVGELEKELRVCRRALANTMKSESDLICRLRNMQ
ncbi:MAG: hypothetical protein A2Y53_00070 [Chloroflexi bacterium RBG_16_47_49]|nr:MAG: hypothetical protein A2Y53_00070 [Chloroflexi bacterium RBG_16_47_49]